MLGILAVVEDAFERGEERVDLGLGGQHYKLRFADRNDPVESTNLIPGGYTNDPDARPSDTAKDAEAATLRAADQHRTAVFE